MGTRTGFAFAGKVEPLHAICYLAFVNFCEISHVFVFMCLLVLFIDKLSCELLVIFSVLHFCSVPCDLVFLVTV